MTWTKLKWQLRYYFQYFPFTLNTLFCAAAAFIAYRLLYRPLPKASEEPAPFLPFILLMAKMAFWFVIALVALSLLSTILSWVYYLWLKKTRDVKLQLQFATETARGKNSRLYMNAQLEGVRRPILGFIKGKLFYDDQQMTDKFSLLSNKKKENSFWRAAVSGKNRLQLPDIKEYELRGGFLFFEDMLHLFSLAVSQPVSGHFYQPPVLTAPEDADVFPKKTESMDVRIDQMRRVEGEYLNYKGFEAGDDVRRIVWKVYAKNRDLVVRVPEMFEPYASHLYFYVSFFASVKSQWLGEGYLKEMLNYYKNKVWTVYDTLAKKEWELRYLPDQTFNVPEHLKPAEKNARIVSNSEWQKDTSLQQYFNTRQGAVLCISSLTDPEELRQVLEQCDGSTVVYFIKCSRVFQHFVMWNWLKRIFFLPPKDRLNKLRARWVFSPMRLQIQKREKEIEEILRRSAVRSGVV
ncbi:MAG TPA: DUF58 domain-containing protein [Flavipsychrobacter sp.]|jgi:hypothetical protein|nr:DUF58 domain-containing protein [Flavipsychrobacter sp.]